MNVLLHDVLNRLFALFSPARPLILSPVLAAAPAAHAPIDLTGARRRILQAIENNRLH